MNIEETRGMHFQSGYTLIEALVVLAIIGMISLISIPSFISINRGNKLKTSLRQFTNDLRLVRQRAVSTTRPVKLSFATGAGKRSYYIFQRPASGGAWTQVDQSRLRRDCPKTPSTAPFPNGCLDESVSFSATTFDDVDSPLDARFDIVFNSGGAITNIKTPPNTVTIASRYANLTKTRYVVELGASGSLTSR